MEKKARMGEKVFANHFSDKGLESRINKEFSKLNSKTNKQTNKELKQSN